MPILPSLRDFRISFHPSTSYGCCALAAVSPRIAESNETRQRTVLPSRLRESHLTLRSIRTGPTPRFLYNARYSDYVELAVLVGVIARSLPVPALAALFPPRDKTFRSVSSPRRFSSLLGESVQWCLLTSFFFFLGFSIVMLYCCCFAVAAAVVVLAVAAAAASCITGVGVI